MFILWKKMSLFFFSTCKRAPFLPRTGISAGSICMYVFLYVCMYVCIYISVCMNVSMYGCRFRYQNVSIFVYMPSQYYNPILIKFIFYQLFKGNLNFILYEPCKVTYSKHLACFKIAKPNLTRWVLTDALGRLVFQYTFS